MGRLNKRACQLRDIRNAKQRKKSEGTATTSTVVDTSATHVFASVVHEVHWEGLSENEESDIEISESEDNISEEDSSSIFDKLRNGDATTAKFPYQRGSELSQRQQTRHRVEQRNLANAAKTHSQPITSFFSSPSLTSSQGSTPASETKDELRQAAITDLEKKLRSKKTALNGQSLRRHRAVLALLLTTQSRRHGETREELSYQISRSYGKGIYFARKLVEWEGTWIRDREIPEGVQGCYAKTSSWFNDEGVQMAVREWCAGAGERT